MATKNLLRATAAAGLATVLSLAAVSSSEAARYYRRNDAPYSGLYNYVPSGGASSEYNRGNATAPPDPASCGGFPC
jgi:hypothetical protein